MTAATTPSLISRFRPTLSLLHAINIVTLYVQLETAPKVKPQPLLLNLINGPDQTTTGDNTIATLEIGQHLLDLFALLLLWPKDEKVENENQGKKQKEGAEKTPRSPSW